MVPTRFRPSSFPIHTPAFQLDPLEARRKPARHSAWFSVRLSTRLSDEFTIGWQLDRRILRKCPLDCQPDFPLECPSDCQSDFLLKCPLYFPLECPPDCLPDVLWTSGKARQIQLEGRDFGIGTGLGLDFTSGTTGHGSRGDGQRWEFQLRVFFFLRRYWTYP